MKIGIDARMYSDSFTGIGRYTYELIQRCIQDTTHEWVIFMNTPEFEKADFPDHVTKILVNAKHYSLAEQTKFLRILHAHKCDLVHFTHFNVPIFYNKPFVVTIHDTTISYFPGKKMNTWIHKIVYNLIMRHSVFGARKIITVSKNTKKDVVKLFRVNPRKIDVIYNGLGNDFYVMKKEEKNKVLQRYELENPFFLYTGVWREHKNIVGMLSAFKMLRDSGRNIDLVITGKEDPYYPEVLDTIKKLGITESVKRVDLVPFDDLVGLYNAASAYIFPSFYEGFGLPPLEAMKVETPVIASNVSAIPEVCDDAALYFDPYKVSDIAQKMKEILEDKKTRKDMVQKGIIRAKYFSWDTCATQTQKIYKTASSFA